MRESDRHRASDVERDVLLDVAAVRSRYPWVRDDRAARRIIGDAGGRIIGGRWAVPLDLLRRWERAWHRPGVARSAAGAAPIVADGHRMVDVPDTLNADWWRDA